MTTPTGAAELPEALRLADSYAKAHAMYVMEDLYGTSKSYTAEMLADRHATRAKLETELRRLHAHVEALTAAQTDVLEKASRDMQERTRITEMPVGVPAQAGVPALSPTEQKWVLRSPVAIAQLLTFIDIDFSQGESAGMDMGHWPPKRYTELKEIGRKLIEQDPECFDESTLREFGFAPQPSPSPAPAQPGQEGELIERLAAQASAHRYMAETDSAALLDEAVTALRAARAAPQPATADAVRLDHLQKTGSTIDLLPGETELHPMRFRVGGLHKAVSTDVREAIDAALAEQQGGTE